MICSRLWREVRVAFGVLVLYYVVGVACAFHSSSSRNGRSESSSLIAVGQEEESGRVSTESAVYYGQMWYRTWQAPVIMILKGTAVLAFLMFTFGTSAIQGAAHYFKNEEDHAQLPQPVVIDGYVESYGDPPHHSFWG